MDDKKENLSEEEQENLKKQFEKAAKEVDKTDVKYAIDKTGDKVGKLESSSVEWIIKLAKKGKLMWMLLRDWWNNEYPNLPWKTIASITAALIYLVNPFDVIPDFIPILGYIDDAFIVSLSVFMVRTDLKDYAEAKGLSLKEFGL